MISVIETGGKQYVVKSGDRISVEKLSVEEGKPIVFDRVLLTADENGENVVVGSPIVVGATIAGTCVSQNRTDKIRVVKYKRKVRYRRVHGHRQHQTEVVIS